MNSIEKNLNSLRLHRRTDVIEFRLYKISNVDVAYYWIQVNIDNVDMLTLLLDSRQWRRDKLRL